ncbi:MAG: heme-binding protein [Planctomycetales bacterium]|nr:heme-binding protein [Planctomycetales bacterium]
MSDPLVTRGHVRLTLAGAKTILAGAEARAREIGVPMDIAVVDSGGLLLAFARMDGAKLTSAEIAINKAFTSAGTRKGTHEYAAIAGHGGPAFGIHASHGGRFTVFGGGLPIAVDGETIGGVGCSSGSPEQDRDVAQAGLDALLRGIKTSAG